MLGEADARGAFGSVVGVAEEVGAAESGDEGGDEGKLLSVRLLCRCLGVAGVAGAGAEVVASAYGVADEGVDAAGEADDGIVCSHGVLNVDKINVDMLICFLLRVGEVVCIRHTEIVYEVIAFCVLFWGKGTKCFFIGKLLFDFFNFLFVRGLV